MSLTFLFLSSDKETEREKLFEGATTDAKPKMRTPAEIMAKYRFAGVIQYEI